MSSSFRALPQAPKGQEDKPQVTPPVWVPPRRGLLSGMAALAAASPAPSSAALQPDPDAALLAACSEHLRLAAEEERLLQLMQLYPIASDEPAAKAADEAWDAACDRAGDALLLVVGMQAITLRGAAAKGLSVLAYRRSIANPGETDNDLDFSDRAALSVLRDLQRLAGGAA